MNRCVFITGTDTGAGKTVLTCLLLEHLRRSGVHALAMKPFCSGGTEDVQLLQAVMDGELSAREINPWFFPEPLAPAASSERRDSLEMDAILERIQTVGRRCEVLFVEGIGGVCVPLNRRLMVLDLIRFLDCEVLLAGRDRLGTLNHTLLSVNVLKTAGIQSIKIVLMGVESPDESSATNAVLLRNFLPVFEVFRIGHLGADLVELTQVKEAAKKLKKTLARVINFDTFSRTSP